MQWLYGLLECFELEWPSSMRKSVVHTPRSDRGGVCRHPSNRICNLEVADLAEARVGGFVISPS